MIWPDCFVGYPCSSGLCAEFGPLSLTCGIITLLGTLLFCDCVSKRVLSSFCYLTASTLWQFWRNPYTGFPLHGKTLQWGHNERDGVSNHQPYNCLLKRIFRRRSKKTSKLNVTGFVKGIHRWPVNSPHKGPGTRKMFPFDDVIMTQNVRGLSDIRLPINKLGMAG